eukprot:CAMPEP_0194529182 /NCGR_PEP_ID=MMETSP0253-20130528/65792_1 /TAXON_ID=2966 /ORGANISM="Noctiluca scintillans" /LENGTH=651 /DNA_ID=CAMNT_0039374299 /DNA_START=52 /DNA_END=2008 /DNA_ORIENTATION=-
MLPPSASDACPSEDSDGPRECCDAEVHESHESKNAWAFVAPEHVTSLASFTMEPRDLCRMELVCQGWCEALRARGEQDFIWRQMCLAWYPTLATLAGTEGGAATRRPSTVSFASTSLASTCASTSGASASDASTSFGSFSGSATSSRSSGSLLLHSSSSSSSTSPRDCASSKTSPTCGATRSGETLRSRATAAPITAEIWASLGLPDTPPSWTPSSCPRPVSLAPCPVANKDVAFASRSPVLSSTGELWSHRSHAHASEHASFTSEVFALLGLQETSSRTPPCSLLTRSAVGAGAHARLGCPVASRPTVSSSSESRPCTSGCGSVASHQKGASITAEVFASLGLDRPVSLTPPSAYGTSRVGLTVSPSTLVSATHTSRPSTAVPGPRSSLSSTAPATSITAELWAKLGLDDTTRCPSSPLLEKGMVSPSRGLSRSSASTTGPPSRLLQAPSDYLETSDPGEIEGGIWQGRRHHHQVTTSISPSLISENHVGSERCSSLVKSGSSRTPCSSREAHTADCGSLSSSRSEDCRQGQDMCSESSGYLLESISQGDVGKCVKAYSNPSSTSLERGFSSRGVHWRILFEQRFSRQMHWVDKKTPWDNVLLTGAMAPPQGLEKDSAQLVEMRRRVFGRCDDALRTVGLRDPRRRRGTD